MVCIVFGATDHVQASANENMAPATLRSIIKETTELLQKPPEGIKLIPNEEDVTDIQAYIDGPESTPYEGGTFRVRLVLSQDFPVAPPKGKFYSFVHALAKINILKCLLL
jgi:ubiquitin-protein ligase